MVLIFMARKSHAVAKQISRAMTVLCENMDHANQVEFVKGDGDELV